MPLAISAFARRCGLTPSALRFYDDVGLLRPASVDPANGYRRYGEEQLERAVLLRRLRDMRMPLAGIAAVLASAPAEALRLVDEHATTVALDADAVRRTAADVRTELGGALGRTVAVVKGPVLADAVEQVLTATAREPGLPVLTGVHVEAGPDEVSLTATDRYRLSTRTLPVDGPGAAWSGTADGDRLRAVAPELRRTALVTVAAAADGLRLGDHHVRLLAEPFPAYRAMLAALDAATTRVTVPKDRLLRALEEHPGTRVELHVTGDGVLGVPGPVTGLPLRIWFELTTLYPAVSTAIGPDVTLDLRGPAGPVTIRSADRGDLTTLAMPVAEPA